MSSDDDCPGDMWVITRKAPAEVMEELVKVYQEAYQNYPEYAENGKEKIISYLNGLTQMRPEGFLVAMLNDEIVGFAVEGFYRLQGERIGEIMEVAISPRAKGKGLGKKILNLLLTVLSRYQCDRVYLEVGRENKIAYKLYQKVGFKSFRDDGKWIHMVKEAASDTQPASVAPQQEDNS